MEKKVVLPRDELLHENQAIEWWYYNGFLKSKRKNYAFMTCLFKAEKDKVNLPFLKVPLKTLYFSHSLLYDLKEKKVTKEILPLVLVSEDSFSKKDLFINYFYPLRKSFMNYEIARFNDDLHVKTKFFDLWAKSEKKPLLEGGKGFIDLGPKSTYYYTYPRLSVSGYVGKDPVQGLAWHDKQWSEQGFMKDSWLWFSLQLADGTDIVCFDYKGKKMATISYPNNRQETCPVTFSPLDRHWKSKVSGIAYHLAWKINVKNFTITTRPLMDDCEMNFGFLNYWEGPLEVSCNGKKGQGFMEHLAEQEPSVSFRRFLINEQKKAIKNILAYMH